jgi:predicted membrane protein
MSKLDNKPAVHQMGVGLVVILVGSLFLLDNLDIFDFDARMYFWPTVLMLLGGLRIYSAESRSSYIFGGALVSVGAIVLLSKLGFIALSVRALWPLVIIAVGVCVIFHALDGKRRAEALTPVGAMADDSVINATAIMGGFERRVNSQAFRGGEVTAIMGGCELDLRNASLEGDAVLNMFVVFGGATLKVPADWTVVVQGTPIMGAFEEKTAMTGDGKKRLVIKGYAIMGGVEIRN